MNVLDHLFNPAWKNVPLEHKAVLASHILRYFVNPLLEVGEVRFATFQQGGIKTETFVVDIAGSPFVFIPGQKEVILGWDEGTNGLETLEIAEDRREIYYALEDCLKHWPQGIDFRDDPTFRRGPSNGDGDLDEWVNEHTSPLRSASIPPLLVEVEPHYVGLEEKGSYSVVSGIFEGDPEWFLPRLSMIKEDLFAGMQEKGLFAEFPSFAVRAGEYLLKQDPALDGFRVFAATPTNYVEARREAEKDGMGLLSRDEWEYCCSGSSRRLFRWGNKIQRKLFEPEESVLTQPNMFGLHIACMGFGPELVEDGEKAKGGWMDASSANVVEKLLPYSSYYLNEVDALDGKETEPLPPGYYCMRRSIRIEL